MLEDTNKSKAEWGARQRATNKPERLKFAAAKLCVSVKHHDIEAHPVNSCRKLYCFSKVRPNSESSPTVALLSLYNRHVAGRRL